MEHNCFLKKKRFRMRHLFILFYLFLSCYCRASERNEGDRSKVRWYFPDHAQLQFAGNIGFISGGVGYTVAKGKLETDLMFGYVPVEFGGPLSSFTLKEMYLPFRPVKMGNYQLDLFAIGLYLNYTLGKRFFFSPATRPQYESGYYDYSSALRGGFYAGGRINRKIDQGCFNKAGLYYELGTYDLALHNYIFNINKSSFRGLFSLALGVKLFFK